MSQCDGFSSREKAKMQLSAETKLGLTVTGKVLNPYSHHKFYTCIQFYLYSFPFFSVRSFVELTRFLFTIPGVTCFLSQRLSQDPLEKFFGSQRQRGGTSENPNVAEFCKNTQALRVINTACADVSRGNCRGNTEEVNLNKENLHIPKRRRKHK